MTVTNDATGLPSWVNFKVKDVEIIDDADVTDEPLSTAQYSAAGVYQSVLKDDLASVKIISPSKVRITGFSNDISTVESIIDYILTQDLTLSITTKSVKIPSLTITSVEIEQSPEMLSASKITIELEQAAPPLPNSGYNPKDAANASVYGIRIQTLSSVTKTVSGLYNTVLTKIGGLL